MLCPEKKDEIDIKPNHKARTSVQTPSNSVKLADLASSQVVADGSIGLVSDSVAGRVASRSVALVGVASGVVYTRTNESDTDLRRLAKVTAGGGANRDAGKIEEAEGRLTSGVDRGVGGRGGGCDSLS